MAMCASPIPATVVTLVSKPTHEAHPWGPWRFMVVRGLSERRGRGGGPDGHCNADLLQCFYNGWQSNANVTPDVQVDWAHT